jgi:hypothetical protein
MDGWMDGWRHVPIKLTAHSASHVRRACSVSASNNPRLAGNTALTAALLPLASALSLVLALTDADRQRERAPLPVAGLRQGASLYKLIFDVHVIHVIKFICWIYTCLKNEFLSTNDLYKLIFDVHVTETWWSEMYKNENLF